MHLDMTPQTLASLLGYSDSEASLAMIQKMMENTPSFDKFAKHIISLNDSLKHLNAYVTLSNSVDKLKIKCEGNDSKELDDEFEELVTHWSEKYNITLQKVENKKVYYIIGRV